MQGAMVCERRELKGLRSPEVPQFRGFECTAVISVCGLMSPFLAVFPVLSSNPQCQVPMNLYPCQSLSIFVRMPGKTFNENAMSASHVVPRTSQKKPRSVLPSPIRAASTTESRPSRPSNQD